MGRDTDMVLYQAEWCPYCARVRKKMTDLLLDYKTVNVPHSHAERGEVKEVSGQTSIPVLVVRPSTPTGAGRAVGSGTPSTESKPSPPQPFIIGRASLAVSPVHV